MKDSKTTLPSAFKSPASLSGFGEDEPILVALSGGADSSALLHMASIYSKQSGAKIYAAHVNHGIRGEEADRDEEFCREFAGKLGVELFVLHADVPKIAAERGESIESAARNVRYEFFDQIMKKHSIRILATAHNANDNLETVIFNIARGSGLGGVCGIPECRPVTKGVVIRPMLAMQKSEIIDYCRENEINFVTDSTNVDTDYTRNLIRAQIVPVLQKINANAVKNACRMSESLRDDACCIDNMVDTFLGDVNDEYSIEIAKIRTASPSIVNRALIKLYDKISDGKTLEATHINALRELARRGVPHSSVTLPSGFEGVIESGKLCLRKIPQKCGTDDYSITLFEGSNPISQTSSEIFIGNSHNAKNVYKKSIVLYIDSDKIEGELFARSRRAGDTIRTGGMTKSLKKLFCEKKIPLELRARLPIICDDKGIVAVPLVAARDGLKTSQSSALAIHFYLY